MKDKQNRKEIYEKTSFKWWSFTKNRVACPLYRRWSKLRNEKQKWGGYSLRHVFSRCLCIWEKISIYLIFFSTKRYKKQRKRKICYWRMSHFPHVFFRQNIIIYFVILIWKIWTKEYTYDLKIACICIKKRGEAKDALSLFYHFLCS